MECGKPCFDLIEHSKVSYRQGCLSETIISDPDLDPTWRVIADLDPDPARGSFRIRILVCEIFVKYSHLKSECTFKGHLCAEIELLC